MSRRNVTITLDEEVRKKAKIKCIKEGKKFSYVIEDCLRKWLKEDAL